jgi:hypothetical protein
LIQSYTYIRHNGEDGDKDHIHLRIEPNKRLDPMDLSNALKEWVNGSDKPLGVRPWRPSKEEDWLLYSVHNPEYLKLKYKNGEKGEKMPYKWQDIKASEGYDVEIAYIRALSYLEHTNANIIKRMREGARPLDLMEEGENAFLINQIVRAIQPSEIERLQRENIELKREYKQLHDNYDVLMATLLEWGFVLNYDNEGNVYLDDTKPYGIEGTQDYVEAP